jgi:hypothetical protein
MALVQRSGLVLRRPAVPRRHKRWPEPLADEGARIVQIHQLGGVWKLQFGQREREPSAPQERRRERLAAKTPELFDHRGERRL